MGGRVCDERFEGGDSLLYIVRDTASPRVTKILDAFRITAPDGTLTMHDSGPIKAPIDNPCDDCRNRDAQALGRLTGAEVRHVKILSICTRGERCLIKSGP
jgi:hypothetical protein